MAQGQKPILSIVAVKKTDKTKKFAIGKGWERDDGNGISGKWEGSYGDRWHVVGIQISNGTETRVARPEDFFLNIYDERMRRDGDSFGGGGSTNRGGGQGGNGGPPDDQGGEMGDDDIPF